MRVAQAVRERAFTWGTWLLGIIFLISASLKGTNVGSFVEEVARYRLVSSVFHLPLALAIIAAEAFLGAACLLDLSTRKALRGILGLLSVFAAATVWRWPLLQGRNCNCFGSILGGGPGDVLRHDLVLGCLVGALVVIAGKTPARHPAWRQRAVLGVLVTGVVITLVAQKSRARSPQGSVSPAAYEVRVLLSARCAHCLESAGKVRALASTLGAANVRIYIGGTNDLEIRDFLSKANLHTDCVPITMRQLSQMTDRVPRVQGLRGGRVVKEWIGAVPSPAELRDQIWGHATDRGQQDGGHLAGQN